ncbi:MAG: type II toxin-antitoxin system VapC family toxin [Planctomycetales bacterium]|nr:type II toxin-antitoxin system VapC family toxin [Planctomycetales bacterium]
MIVLDTDHLSVLLYAGSSGRQQLISRMTASPDQEFVTTIVNVEELFRGWWVFINRKPDIQQQVFGYERFGEALDFLNRWTILALSTAIADRFPQLRQSCRRVGSMDLKVAAITLEHDAVLLSANLRDFRQVPNLKAEDWLH